MPKASKTECYLILINVCLLFKSLLAQPNTTFPWSAGQFWIRNRSETKKNKVFFQRKLAEKYRSSFLSVPQNWKSIAGYFYLSSMIAADIMSFFCQESCNLFLFNRRTQVLQMAIHLIRDPVSQNWFYVPVISI